MSNSKSVLKRLCAVNPMEMAEKLHTLEAENEALKQELLKLKEEFNSHCVDVSDAELTRSYREGIQEGRRQLNNELAESEPVAFGERFGTNYQSAWCVPDTGVPPWMENTTPLITRTMKIGD